jgi:nucleoside-diphosphate-sugar epimerase
MLQTILGAGGAIGTELAIELTNYTNKIRLVSRNPVKVNPGDELFSTDVTKAEQVDKAVEGSSVVYLVAGLEYKTTVWQKQWPLVMKNVITACKKQGSKLVFFDNLYMYDKDQLGNITEETKVNPVSKKGKVRAEIAGMLLSEIQNGGITALIARAADFISPKNSVLIEMVYKNLAKGKKADWFVSTDYIHSFTFTPDAAKATALLGNTPDAFN